MQQLRRLALMAFTTGLCVLARAPAASAYCFLQRGDSTGLIDTASCTMDPSAGVTWEYSCAEIGINPDGLPADISLAQFRSAVDDAANTWNNARCPGGGAPAFNFVIYPDVDAPYGWNESGSNANLVSFRSPWPNDLMHLPGAPSAEILWYNADSAHIFLFDLDMNPSPSSLFQFSVTGTPGAIDVQTFVTQQLGHMLGLGLSTDPNAVMYSMLDPTMTVRHDLGTDDIAGFCQLYPPGGSNVCEADPTGGFAGSNGCGCEVTGRPVHNTGALGTALAAVFAGIFMRRARRRQTTRPLCCSGTLV